MSGPVTPTLIDQLADAIVTRLVNSFNIQPAQPVNAPPPEDTLLTRKEVLKLLSITAPTLSKWQKTGAIKAHRVQRRVYFRKADIEKALKPVNAG